MVWRECRAFLPGLLPHRQALTWAMDSLLLELQDQEDWEKRLSLMADWQPEHRTSPQGPQGPQARRPPGHRLPK